jgi:hypothetical protein
MGDRLEARYIRADVPKGALRFSGVIKPAVRPVPLDFLSPFPNREPLFTRAEGLIGRGSEFQNSRPRCKRQWRPRSKLLPNTGHIAKHSQVAAGSALQPNIAFL